MPVYPADAIRLRLGGTTVIEIVVSEAGDVVSRKVLSGPPLLAEAAMEAVRQRKHSPWLENGKPVPFTAAVDMRLTHTNLDRGGGTESEVKVEVREAGGKVP
jgi:protein TonB